MELRKLAALYIRSKVEDFLPFFYKDEAAENDITSEGIEKGVCFVIEMYVVHRRFIGPLRSN
jgi:hypothetical protein